MSDEAPTEAVRLVLEFPLEAGEAWLETFREVAAPHVLRLGQVKRPDKLVLICELEDGGQKALLDAVKAAWDARQAEDGIKA